MDELTLAKVAQEAFRIAPARGNVAAGTVRVHVDSNMLHRLHSVPTMELKGGGKPRPFRSCRGGPDWRSCRRIGDCERGWRAPNRSLSRASVNPHSPSWLVGR